MRDISFFVPITSSTSRLCFAVLSSTNTTVLQYLYGKRIRTSTCTCLPGTIVQVPSTRCTLLWRRLDTRSIVHAYRYKYTLVSPSLSAQYGTWSKDKDKKSITCCTVYSVVIPTAREVKSHDYWYLVQYR